MTLHGMKKEIKKDVKTIHRQLRIMLANFFAVIAPDYQDKKRRFLLVFQLQKLMPMNSNGETWCKKTSENSNNCPKTRSYPNYVPKQV